MSLIDKHFPPHRKLHKLFNRKNVKISYSCLPNVKPIINALNRNILYPSPTTGRRNCNCINISQCPLHNVPIDLFRFHWKYFNTILSFLWYSRGENNFVSSNKLLSFNMKSIIQYKSIRTLLNYMLVIYKYLL